MFRAIGRFFRSIGYLLTGKVDSARENLTTNPNVVRATYDNVIQEKKARIHQYKDAIGAMVAQEEKKKSALKKLTEEVTRLQKLRDGAAAMVRKVVERHKGDTDAVKADPDYQKCQASFKDFRSTLEEKEARCQELEDDLRTIEKTVSGHKIQLQSLLRDMQDIQQEKHETVADIITAKEEKEISDIVTGISEDRTSEELQELRDIRDKAKATARVSREMSGLDAKRSEEEFLDFAAKSAADSEFDALIGLTQESVTPEEEGPDRTRIPES